ncbi:MAG: bifunctional oligoribonuclease/PAP phosphatase NrnA [Verrucomicrobiae bacterium]|nr:bifunctional oligoribonuclease/PAP phosphatase NrnA [Verrucomicrobiae bacterium]
MTDPGGAIVRLLREHQSFLVLTHYRPDGDAVGSQLALTILLKEMGKQVAAWNEDQVPAKFLFLPQSHLIVRPPESPRDFDVVIVLDTSTWQRLGTAGERIGQRRLLVNVDHHVSNENFGDINWVVPEASSTGLMVFDLIRRGGFPLGVEVATCLYVAIATDTGNFTYASTSATAFRAAADLVEAGVNVGDVCRHVYESYPLARLQLLQLTLADLTLADHNRIAYYWVTNEKLRRSGARREDIEGLIDYARSIEGVIVAVLFEELPEAGKFRMSLRSKHPKVDVNRIARRFGGGGHPEAAGARLAGTPQEIEAKVIAAISAAIREAGL